MKWLREWAGHHSRGIFWSHVTEHQGPNILRSSRVTQNPWRWISDEICADMFGKVVGRTCEAATRIWCWAFALFSVKRFAKWLYYLNYFWIDVYFQAILTMGILLLEAKTHVRREKSHWSSTLTMCERKYPPAFADIISSWLTWVVSIFTCPGPFFGSVFHSHHGMDMTNGLQLQFGFRFQYTALF